MKDITEKYLSSLFELDSDLKKLKQLGIANEVPIIRDITAQFLSTFVKITRPKTILEIGTGVGYSGTVILKSVPDAKFVGVELDSVLVDVARHNLNKYDATVLLGDCRKVVPDLLHHRKCDLKSSEENNNRLYNLPDYYDLIFMDGPKSAYNQLLDDFISLLSPNGVLVCDNVLYNGRVADLDSNQKVSTIVRNLREFLKKINQAPFKSTVLDVGDGISLTTKMNN